MTDTLIEMRRRAEDASARYASAHKGDRDYADGLFDQMTTLWDQYHAAVRNSVVVPDAQYAVASDANPGVDVVVYKSGSGVCDLCDTPSDDLRHDWTPSYGHEGCEVWVSSCPVCRGEEDE